MTQTPVILVTGFLGAGKTTFINQLIVQPGLERTTLIVNEFGDINIDAALVKRRDDAIIELTSGCVCCALQGTLADTLAALVDSGLDSTERVLIETTGLANAGPIVHTIAADETLARSYRFDRVITLVDALYGTGTLDRHPEAIEQVAIADLVIVTKTDLHPDPADLIGRIHALNPSGTVRVAPHASIDASLVFATTPELDETKWHDATGPSGGTGHDAHISSLALTRTKPMSQYELQVMVAAIGLLCGPNMLRLKGLINVVGAPGPALLQGVQDTISDITWLERWPDSDHTTRMVFIGWDLDERALSALVEER